MDLIVDIEEVVAVVKTKIPNSSVDADTIQGCIDEVCQAVKLYCNRDDIPARLKYTISNMTVDLLKSMAINGDIIDDKLSAVSPGAISLIKDGDSETRFKTAKTSGGIGAHVGDVDSILLNYVSQLNKCRILKW